MKRKALYIGVMLLFLSSCNKLHKLTQFYIDYNSDYTYVAGVPANLPFNITSPDIETNSEEQFEINDTRKDKIESIKLDKATLTITSPSDADFSFVKNIRVYISTENVGETMVASKENIPDNIGTRIELDIVDAELKEYIKADKFKLRIESTNDQLLTRDIHVNVYTKFFVDAKILGL